MKTLLPKIKNKDKDLLSKEQSNDKKSLIINHELELEKDMEKENSSNYKEINKDKTKIREEEILERIKKKTYNNIKKEDNNDNIGVNDNNEKIIKNESDDENENEEINQKLKINAKLLNNEKLEQIFKKQEEILNPFMRNDFKVNKNGLLQIDPKIVVFTGFNLNHLNDKNYIIQEKIVKIINTSKFPQRMTIIPPSTVFFKAKFSRSGLVPCGLAETIVIQFMPNEYKYYYDFIQVYGEENEKLIIPIHAFPVMNINKYPKYIPRYINFDSVIINHSSTKEINLKNLISSASFEYEFVPIKTCNEIILNPLYGEIKESSEVNISISFNPHKYGTFISEYEFRTSEFDFKPLKLTVSGVCKTVERPLLNESTNFNRLEKHSNNPEENNIESTYERMRSFKYKLKPTMTLNERIQKQKEEEDKINALKPINPSEYLANLNAEKEKSFIDYFDYCSNLIRDKEIKYKKFIGCKILTSNEDVEIFENKFNEYKQYDQFYRKMYSKIHKLTLNSKFVSISNKNFVLKPLFNENNNNKFYKNRKYFRIILAAITKLVINKRARINLSKLTPLLPNSRNNITSLENNQIDKSKAIYDKVDVLLDNSKNQKINLNVNKLSRLNSSIIDKDKDNNNKRNNEDLVLDQNLMQEDKILITENKFSLNFSFPYFNSLNKNTIMISDFNIDYSKQKVEYENNINFEDFHEYKYFDRMDQELMNYKGFKSNGISNYEISLSDKELRPSINCFESYKFG